MRELYEFPKCSDCGNGSFRDITVFSNTCAKTLTLQIRIEVTCANMWCGQRHGFDMNLPRIRD